LGIIKEALEKVGIRAILCYEVTDRNGKSRREQGIQENEDFIRSHSENAFFRGLVGAHASFTLEEDTLLACAELAQDCSSGIHIHLAEDEHDAKVTRRKYNVNPVRRLEQASAFTPKSVLAHGTHLSRTELAIIRGMESWLVHNPRSNMNNSVGYAPVKYFGERSALGTDGFLADMFEEGRIGFFKSRDAASGLSPKDFARLIQSGHKLCSEIFGAKMGSLNVGSVADLIVLDYSSPTPLTPENIALHLTFGMRSSNVESVMVGGRWIIKNRNFEQLNVEEIYEKARKVASDLWGNPLGLW
jgi:cytosine/adenosine deaminase-related metal-dependent hydrolase